MNDSLINRCGWAKLELDVKYHDTEWGVPVYDDQKLFEFIILEMAQAGLSWSIILKKRENYRKAYDNFNPTLIAHYDNYKKLNLLEDIGIVRNKLKIAASIINAQAFLKIQDEFKSFSNYIWQFTENKVIYNRPFSQQEIPNSTELSVKISKELKTKGFKFLGPITCYAFLQAVGIVNDHVTSCFRYND